MILLDTNVLIEFYKNNPGIVRSLRDAGQENLAISVITQAELYFGARDKNELQSLRQHLALLSHYPIDSSVSGRFIELMETFVLSHKLSIPDGLIAATALVHDLELFTLNIRDFRYIPALRLFPPISDASP